jgi:hypothetical protein
VVLLQSVRSYPCVSLLLSTTPAPVMAGPDADRLRGLLGQTRQRLRAEGDKRAAAPVLEALERLVGEAVTGPTSQALAVFAGAHTATTLHLPVDVRERAVVDPTFATRDLVRALHRTPRHLVLVLSSRDARLFEGVGNDLRPARSASFPMLNPRDREDASGTAAFFRTVDRALGTVLRVHPAPLVLAGPARSLSAFQSLSGNLGRLAGTIPAFVANEPLSQLAARTRPILEQYLLSRQEEALRLLDRRTGAKRAVSGMTGAWLAARSERPEMLAVEQGLFFPARLSSDGDLIIPATDVEHPTCSTTPSTS